MPVFFSKNYTTTENIATGATSKEQIISEADQWASGPFDQITINNKDSQDVQILLDGNPDNAITVFAYSRESSRELKFLNVKIKNIDTGTHTAGTIQILVENTKFPRRG